jgi:hypothetical protein
VCWVLKHGHLLFGIIMDPQLGHLCILNLGHSFTFSSTLYM